MPDRVLTQTTLSPGQHRPGGRASCGAYAQAPQDWPRSTHSTRNRPMARKQALLMQRPFAMMRLPCGIGPAWRRPFSCVALFLCCGGATSVLTDTMPSCASGWLPASPSGYGAGSWRHDVEVTVDATLVVRGPDGRIVAILHKGDRRAWECASLSTRPNLSS